MRVLLIDDHAAIREALASAFEQEVGSEVVGQAGSLAQARRMLEEEQQQADVALIDLGLPDGNGLDLVQEINDGGAGNRLPTLVLTANLDNSVAAQAMDAGAKGAFSKAGSVPDTVEAIKRLTDARRQER